MTDTPTPERGEAYDADDEHNLGDLGHQALYVALERAKDNKTGVMLSWQIANGILRGYAKAKQNRDALRAECARKDAKIARLRGALKDLYERMDCSLCRTSPDFAFCGGCIADRERARTLLNPGAPRDGE